MMFIPWIVGFLPSFLDIPQIPDFKATLVASTDHKIRGGFVPADNIHVALMRGVNASYAFSALTSYVPDMY